MDTAGFVAPVTAAEATAIYDELGPIAQEIVRDLAIAFEFDGDEYDERMSADVVTTARNALFGSLLVVTTASRGRFDAWMDSPPYDEYAIEIEGSEHVDHVAWHEASMVDRVVAATYQDEKRAAISTLRRIAWGRIYHDVLTADGRQ